jgi:hypothetical protein
LEELGLGELGFVEPGVEGEFGAVGTPLGFEPGFGLFGVALGLFGFEFGLFELSGFVEGCAVLLGVFGLDGLDPGAAFPVGGGAGFAVGGWPVLPVGG